MRAHGFTLIELVIATALSLLLSGVLYQLFKQIRQSVTSTQTRLETVQTVSRFLDIIQKDINSAFVIELPKNQQVKEKDIPEKQFYATHEREHLKVFSLLTTHVMPVYGEQIPARVRVMYRVQESTPEFIKITRQESTNLNVKDFEGNKIYSYDLIDRIKTLNMRFFVAGEKKEQRTSSVELAEWGTDEQKKKTKALLPDYVLISGIYQDAQGREESFEQRIPIFAKPPILPEKDLQTTSTIPTGTAVPIRTPSRAKTTEKPVALASQGTLHIQEITVHL